MNETQSKFDPLLACEYPPRSEEALSPITEKNSGESLLIGGGAKIANSSAPQHVAINNFEIEEEEEGESIKQDKVNTFTASASKKEFQRK